MKVLRVIFEIYNEQDGQFATAVLFIQEEQFSVKTIWSIACKNSYIICSDLKIDELIAAKCLEGSADIGDAYTSAIIKGYHLKVFPDVGKLSLNPFFVPRFEEEDFKYIIEGLGGRKIPEADVKTPDFVVGSVILELKDLQSESLKNRDRQIAIAKLCETINTRTIDLQVLIDNNTLSFQYRKLIANTIKNHLKKASDQVKSYALNHNVSAAGIIILNTGSLSLSHEVLKPMVEDILKNNTKRISFALVFTQKMQSNGFDLYANYWCEFVGDTPESIKSLREEVNNRVSVKMKKMLTDPSSISKVAESLRPFSFVVDNKLFYWNPGKVSGELTAALEAL